MSFMLVHGYKIFFLNNNYLLIGQSLFSHTCGFLNKIMQTGGNDSKQK